MTIAFIGGGNMATAMISGLKTNGFDMQTIEVVEPDAGKRSLISNQFQVKTIDQLVTIAHLDALILAVKPQQLKAVCLQIADQLTLANVLVISIAAGVRALDISRWLHDHQAIIRVMPNTPAQIQAGISALFALKGVSQAQRKLANTILAAVGKTLWLNDEKDMDAVTAISGSGPAYVFYLIEALQEAAIHLGLTPEDAKLLALETFAGASKLATQSSYDVQTLRAQVTSKGGTTEQGILVMQSEKIKEIMLKTAQAAAEKSVVLGNALSEP